MASAGYPIPSGLLRGQILHSALTEQNDNTSLSVKELEKYRFSPEKDERNSIYKFSSAVQEEDQENKVVSLLNGCGQICQVVRDYIACWFSSVDESIVYEDEKKRRKRLKKQRRR